MRRATLLMLVGGLGWSTPSRADEPRRFHLEYHGSPACQQEAELLSEIAQRTPTAQRVSDEPADVSVRVSIDGSDEQAAAVDIDGADGHTHRDLTAPDCAQLGHALALILTIAIEPDARAPQVTASRSEVTPQVSQAAPLRSAESAVVRPPLWWAVGLGVGLLGGVAPSPAFAQALSFELGRGHAEGLAAHLRLSGLHAHDSANALAGKADFDWLALRLASCPYRFGTRLSLAACASFDFGRLRGRGSLTRAERTGTADWYGPGVFGAAALRALPWLRVQVELGALAPLARDRFYFGPAETVHRIPALAGYGGLDFWVGG